jgi:hypothetical protein
MLLYVIGLQKCNTKFLWLKKRESFCGKNIQQLKETISLEVREQKYCTKDVENLNLCISLD